jgi:hypothetical protein
MVDLRLSVDTINLAFPKPAFLIWNFSIGFSKCASLTSSIAQTAGCRRSRSAKEHQVPTLHPTPRGAACAGVLLYLSSSFVPASGPRAQGVSASACLPAAAESQLQRRETEVLGKTHAAEHALARAQQCEVQRGLRPVPASNLLASPEASLQESAEVIQAATDAAAGVRTTTSSSAQKAAAGASKVGTWSAPFVIPVVGVTAVLLKTGKVLFWSYDPATWLDPNNSNLGVAYVFDPVTRTGHSITPPENIWCGGQTVLADGRIFLAGGNLSYPNPNVTDGTGGWKGTSTTYTFNPLTELFTRQPDMVRGRWYPTTTRLADNRVVITSGYDESGTEALNKSVEVFTPSAAMDGIGTISAMGTHDVSGLYPLQFLLPSARMLEAGPNRTSSNLFDPQAGNWSPLGAMRGDHYDYANGIIYTDASVNPSRQLVMVAGGQNGTTAVSGNESLDGANTLAGWRDYPRWLQPRHNSNTVILPDGTLLTVGGNRATTTYDQPLLQAELYSKPAADSTGSWQEVAAPAVQAAYHSSAILLPDATVLLSQDDMDHSAVAAAQHKAQIYSPPYLFKGARPRIVSGPDNIRYGQSFSISADRGVTSAVLVAPGATTHGNDMNQRVVKLAVTARSNTLSVTTPASPAILPPGPYMLFILDKFGIPSVAKFVQVS